MNEDRPARIYQSHRKWVLGTYVLIDTTGPDHLIKVRVLGEFWGDSLFGSDSNVRGIGIYP